MIETPTNNSPTSTYSRSTIEMDRLLTKDEIEEILKIPVKNSDLVGEGCMGKAYRIEYKGIPMVLKIQKYNEEFLNEIWKHQALSENPKIRPHIPMFYGSYEDVANNKGYIVMEYLEGKTLRNIYDSENLTKDDCNLIFDRLEAILKLFHEEGFVYYDLAPCNVFIEKENGSIKAVKLIDFGWTKFKGNNNNNAYAHESVNTFKFATMKKMAFEKRCSSSGGKSRKQKRKLRKASRKFLKRK